MDSSLLSIQILLLVSLPILAFVGGYFGVQLANRHRVPPMEPRLFDRQLEACERLHKRADLLAFATRRHLLAIEQGETPDPAPVLHVLERFVSYHADQSVILPIAVLHALSRLTLCCLPAVQGRPERARIPAMIENLDHFRAELLSTMRRCLIVDRFGQLSQGVKAPASLENFAALDAFHRELMAKRSEAA